MAIYGRLPRLGNRLRPADVYYWETDVDPRISLIHNDLAQFKTDVKRSFKHEFTAKELQRLRAPGREHPYVYVSLHPMVSWVAAHTEVEIDIGDPGEAHDYTTPLSGLKITPDTR